MLWVHSFFTLSLCVGRPTFRMKIPYARVTWDRDFIGRCGRDVKPFR